MVFGNRDLGARYDHGYWGVPTSSQLHIHLYTYTLICMYISSYTYIHTYVHLRIVYLSKNHELFIQICPILIWHHSIHSSFFPCHNCNFLSWKCEIWLLLSLIYLFIWSIPLYITNFPSLLPTSPSVRMSSHHLGLWYFVSGWPTCGHPPNSACAWFYF